MWVPTWTARAKERVSISIFQSVVLILSTCIVMCSHAQKHSTANQITGWVGRALALVEKALGGLTKRQRKSVHFPIGSVSFCLSLLCNWQSSRAKQLPRHARAWRQERNEMFSFPCHKIIIEASDTLKTFPLTKSACQSTQLWRSDTPLSPSLTCSLTLSLL